MKMSLFMRGASFYTKRKSNTKHFTKMKKTQVSNSKKGIKSTSPKNESTRTSLPIDPSWCRLFDEFVHDNGKELHDEQVKDLIQTTRDLLFSDDWQIQSNSLKNICKFLDVIIAFSIPKRVLPFLIVYVSII